MMTSRYALSLLVCGSALVGLALGYGSGAPSEVCGDLTPQHGVPPQNTPFPYNVIISRNKIRSGESVDIVITGKSGQTFKGYIVQARVGNQPVGKFTGGNTVDCAGGSQNAATHSDASEKPQVNLKWTAPPGLKETVTFYTTVAKNGGEFWVAQKSRPVTVF